MMLREIIGVTLALAGWWTARAVTGAWKPWPLTALAMDGIVPLASYAVLLGATGKPGFSGAVAFAAFAGYGFADHVKRLVLREPVVFTDMSEVIELFRHPDLYLPFAGTSRVLAGAALAFAAFAAAYIYEPPVFAVSLAQVLISIALGLGAIAVSVLLVPPWARLLRRFQPSGDPFADTRAFGPFATIGIYGVTARAERKRRQAVTSRALAAPPPAKGTPPVILVQSESFFDARRLNPTALEDFMPGLARLQTQSLCWGRLAVPCWGANTTRSEFSALTGLGDRDTGFDRFNPYHAFAKARLASLAHTFKARGYETICIHPFDGRFYGRRKIMPLLGFDRFIEQDAFEASDKVGDYIGDLAVARLCEELLNGAKPVFLFIVSMQNHGPWTLQRTARAALPPALAGVTDSEGLSTYLGGLKDADGMMTKLAAALATRNGLLGFYGDHLPSLPATFAQLGFGDADTDYFVWRTGGVAQGRRDIAVQDLPAMLLDALSL